MKTKRCIDYDSEEHIVLDIKDVKEKIQNVQKRLIESVLTEWRGQNEFVELIDKIFLEEFGEKLIAENEKENPEKQRGNLEEIKGKPLTQEEIDELGEEI